MSQQFFEYYTDRKTSKALNTFTIGFIGYSLFYTIAITSYVNYAICECGQIFCLLLIISVINKLVKFEIKRGFLKATYMLYSIWLFMIILRGINFLSDYHFLQYFLLDPFHGGMLYFVPLILLFPQNIFYLNNLFRCIDVLGVFFIIFTLFFYKTLLEPDGENIISLGLIENFAQVLSFSSGFILLTYVYHTKKRVLLSLFVIILTFLLALIRARRGLIFVSTGILILSYFIFLYSCEQRFRKVMFSIIVIPLTVIYGVSIYKGTSSGTFKLITERIDDDTRSGVEVAFHSNMTTIDWIFGRGLHGQYYFPGIEEGVDYRSVIETGYLQIILNGGIVSLTLLLLIAIPAVVRGLFYSKNILSKAASLWIVLELASLYPATAVTFTLQYLIVWISIGICYSNTIINLPEDVLKQYFTKLKIVV